MAVWLQYLIGFGAALVVVPLLGLAGRWLGSRTKGGLMLASLMGGFGDVLDRPAKLAMESTEPAKPSPENGDPPRL